MLFTPAEIPGVWTIELEPKVDERGFFARTWCREEFAARGLETKVAQTSISFNVRRGTLRGMHYQVAPHEEIKLIRCTRGSIHDVLLDLRTSSPTFKKWTAFELTAENGKSLYVPGGVAHGFQTLADETEVFYQMTEAFYPESARGVRWNDPVFGIGWPSVTERIMSDRDASYPDFA